MEELLARSKLDTCEAEQMNVYRMRINQLNKYTSVNNEQAQIALTNFELGYFVNGEKSIHKDKMFVKEEDQEYGIELPNPYMPFFDFVEPVIYIDKDGVFTQNYKNISVGDKLFIYQLLHADGTAWHLAAVIVTKDNKHISFGMGYAGILEESELPATSTYYDWFSQKLSSKLDKNTKGVLYSPDHVFVEAVKRQLTKDHGKFLKLIASTDLTAEYVQLLNEEFDKLKSDDITCYIGFHKLPINVLNSTSAKGNLTKLKHYIQNDIHNYDKVLSRLKSLDEIEVVQNQKDLLILYSSTLDSGEIPVACVTNYIDIPHRSYCKISNTDPRQQGANCTSFLQKIFKGLLNCSGYLGASDKYVSHPNYCRQSPNVHVSNCIERKILKPASKRLTVQNLIPRPMETDQVQQRERIKRSSDVGSVLGKHARLEFLFKDKEKTKRACNKYVQSLTPKQKLKLLIRDEKHLNELVRQMKHL